MPKIRYPSQIPPIATLRSTKFHIKGLVIFFFIHRWTERWYLQIVSVNRLQRLKDPRGDSGDLMPP